MASLLLLLALILLLIQELELRFILMNGEGSIEIDYSVFTLILKSDKKRKKRAKSIRRAAPAMLRPVRFLAKRSSLTVKRINLVSDPSHPMDAALGYGYLGSVIIGTLSLLSIFSDVSLYENALSVSGSDEYHEHPTADIAIRCRLFHIFSFGFIFLIEYIKRNVKNGRKQNE